MIIDVSKHQGEIDWPRLRAEGGVDYAIIRATMGATGHDEMYERNWRESGWAGVPRRTVYHYQTRDTGPAQLANILAALAGKTVNAPVTVDVERTAAERAAMANGWIFPVTAYTEGLRVVCFGLAERGYSVRIYSNFWEWITVTSRPGWAGVFGFHVAGYPTIPCDPRYIPRIPLPWTRWEMWQCSSTGRLPGIAGNVDLNVAAVPASEPPSAIPSQFGAELDTVDRAAGVLKGLVG